MTNNQKIHKFSQKWLEKFHETTPNYEEFLDHSMAEECSSLGFDMDCGKAFESAYGKAVYNSDELALIIDDISDIALLGSAIYARWRYFNHYSYDGREILEPKNREWFTLALGRLAELSC